MMDNVDTVKEVHERAWLSLERSFARIQRRIEEFYDPFKEFIIRDLDDDWDHFLLLTENDRSRTDRDIDEIDAITMIDPNGNRYRRTDGEKYLSPEDDEADETLIENLRSIAHGIRNRESTNIRSDFDDLANTCERLTIGIEYELEEAGASFDILDVQRVTLIYTQSRTLVHVPELIINVNAEILRMISRTPDIMFRISPRKFEEIIAELFFAKGYKVELTRATRDGGRDIIAISEHMDLNTKYLIECKRYAPHNKISVGIVQRLLGVKVAEAANKAILATTSTFTRDARSFASDHMWDLELKDSHDILSWIRDYIDQLQGSKNRS